MYKQQINGPLQNFSRLGCISQAGQLGAVAGLKAFWPLPSILFVLISIFPALPITPCSSVLGRGHWDCPRLLTPGRGSHAPGDTWTRGTCGSVGAVWPGEEDSVSFLSFMQFMPSINHPTSAFYFPCISRHMADTPASARHSAPPLISTHQSIVSRLAHVSQQAGAGAINQTYTRINFYI